jgi:hypothetical protein
MADPFISPLALTICRVDYQYVDKQKQNGRKKTGVEGMRQETIPIDPQKSS